MSEIGSFSEMKDINGSFPEISEFRKIKPEEGITFKDSQDFWNDFFGNEIPIDEGDVIDFGVVLIHETAEIENSNEEVIEGKTELAKEVKQEICEKTGWSEEIVDMMKSKEEAEIYMNAGLEEWGIDGKECLVRPDIDMGQKDEFGQTNKERMENGNPPLTKNGEIVELHHIGQKPDSPLAELTMQEHRGRGNDSILHEKQKESEIDRNEFAKERRQHWESRLENL